MCRRVTLKCLFLGVTVLSVLCAAAVGSFQRWRKDIAEIESVGGHVVYDASTSLHEGPMAALNYAYYVRVQGQCTSVHLNGAQTLSERQADSICALKADSLLAHGVKLLPGALATLCRSATLEAIVFADTNVSNADLHDLMRLEKLSDLELRNCDVSDEGAIYLSRLPLVRLDLSGTKISDRTLSTLTNCKTLRFLDVEGTSVTDQGVREMRHRCAELEINYSFSLSKP